MSNVNIILHFMPTEIIHKTSAERNTEEVQSCHYVKNVIFLCLQMVMLKIGLWTYLKWILNILDNEIIF